MVDHNSETAKISQSSRVSNRTHTFVLERLLQKKSRHSKFEVRGVEFELHGGRIP